MNRFIECEDRAQASLLPEPLDDYIAEDNPVRLIEAFLDGLDLEALGFGGIEANRYPISHAAISNATITGASSRRSIR